MQTQDPYSLDDSKVLDPPTSLKGTIKHLGPGFILSASIVGSGELVATTQLGAGAGFVALWVILVSCLVKVAIQLEFGKRAIMTGETTFASFNTLPGKIGKAHWSIWTWLGLMLVKFLQVGGIVGLVAVLLNMAIPSVTVLSWLVFVVVAVASIVISGYYRVLEIMSIVMIGIFTLFTLFSLIALQYTDSAIALGDVLSGLQFKMPEGDGMTLLVIGAFGITGVGGDEIMAYNYWLIEKGYAANAGKNDGSENWTSRAKGWIRVMYIDAIFAMAVYTIVTVAFFLLGCALLHGEGDFIKVGGADFLRNLSDLYTSTLGSWAGPFFYIGAFVVLFSTAFSALGAWTRQFTDAFARVGLLDFDNYKSRKKCITLLSIVIPVLWGAVYLFFKSPVWMVLIGGFVTSIILIVVLYAAIIFKKQRADSSIQSGALYEIAFWSSSAMILFVGIWTVLSKFL